MADVRRELLRHPPRWRSHHLDRPVERCALRLDAHSGRSDASLPVASPGLDSQTYRRCEWLTAAAKERRIVAASADPYLHRILRNAVYTSVTVGFFLALHCRAAIAPMFPKNSAILNSLPLLHRRKSMFTHGRLSPPDEGERFSLSDCGSMAQDVATLGMVVDDSADWNPPPVIPLNLRSHLGKFGIGNDDLLVIEGLPEGAELSVGVCKPDGSWSVRAAEIDNAAFIPLYENGETYSVKVCLLTPDPSDHGLPKTKGKAQFTLKVPLAALPVLEAFEDVAPKPKKAPPATEAVIILGADPTLKTSAPQPAAVAAAPQQIAPPPAAVAPAPAAPAPQPIAVPPPVAAAAPIAAPAPALTAAPAPAAAPAPVAATPTIDLEKHFAALRTE